MTQEEQTLSELTPIERKILPILLNETKHEEIIKKTKLQEIEVLRGFQWLSNKKLITLEKHEQEFITLDENGKKYSKQELPEKKLLKEIETTEKTLSKLQKTLSKEEINISIGILKKKSAINITKKGEELAITITETGKKILKTTTPEEEILTKKFPLEPDKITQQEKTTIEELLKRKNILKKEKNITWTAKLTNEGKKIAEQAIKDTKQYTDKLTPEMLKTGTWKNTEFRAYDIKSKVPTLEHGKKHFVNEAIDYIRKIWLELGFEEMEGNHVQSAFWDLDALFVPQDHPAREMQDTFYLDKKSKINKETLRKVKEVHENGANTGSKGWQTKYSEEIATQTLLRTHTTVISAQKISQLKREDLPKKFFIVSKVYRNEALDWKHLFEFNQVEGIVVDPDANLAMLKGYLKEFFQKMGYPDARIRPAHFPYTEPSAEVEVYNPKKKQWVEMGGCGIFRPEVTKTLMGFECPVLAWGLGMERIISTYYEINDLREIYKNDAEQLKKMKVFIK